MIGDNPPGEGPSGTSGNCPHNFVSVYWTNMNGWLVDTQSPVPVTFLVDEQNPSGPPGYENGVLSIIGSCKLSIAVPTKAPQTLTFLVVASNIDYEIQLHIINYCLFNLDPDSFFSPRPPSWPEEPTYQPPFVPPSLSAQQMRLKRTSINHTEAGSRTLSRFTGGISTSRTPRRLSNWREADTTGMEQEAQVWSNNGMAPWPCRVNLHREPNAHDRVSAPKRRWAPNIPLDAASPRHCWSCRKMITWAPDMTWPDHKAVCAEALQKLEKVLDTAPDTCYWCNRAVEGCICGHGNSHSESDTAFPCDVMRLCDW